MARGAGTAVIDRLPYLAELAIDCMKEIECLILVGAPAGVVLRLSQRPQRHCASRLPAVRAGRLTTILTRRWRTCSEGLDAVNAAPVVYPLTLPDLGVGPLDVNKVAQAVAHFLPENAVVVDESITSSCVDTGHHHPAPRLAQSYRWQYRLGPSPPLSARR